MTVIVAIPIALIGGLVGLAARAVDGRARVAGVVVALAAALACVALAVTSPVGESVSVGGVRLTVTSTVRLALFAWSAGLVGLGLVGLGLRSRDPAAPGLVALAGALAALAADQPALGFAALAVGGAAAVIVPALGGVRAGITAATARSAAEDGREARGGRRDASLASPVGAFLRGAMAPSGAAAAGPLRASIAAAAAMATLGTGVVAMVLVAWARSPVGASASGAVVVVQDVAFQSAIGLAVLAMGAVVAVRLGAIPAHLWGARLVGAVSPLMVPSPLGWGSAVFSVVAVSWAAATLGTAGTALDPPSRAVVAIVAIGGLALGGLASALHDDLEHVLGYWLVGAAGLTLLAFGALGPGTSTDVADWSFGVAAVATGFAAWIAVARWSFAGVHRVAGLGGWARRSPLLGLALVLLLLGAVGLPGSAMADARTSISGGALPDPIGPLVSLGAAAVALVVFGRLLLAGLGRPIGDVTAAPRDRIGRFVSPPGGWTGGGARWWARRGAAIARANRALALQLLVVALSGIGLAVAVLGTGAGG